MAESITIEPSSEKHVEGLRKAVGLVARERRYLASLHGFSAEATAGFVRFILEGGGVQFVALDGDRVVGWCDVRRQPFEGFAHGGVLGMGLLSEFRGRGLGQRLLEEAIRAASEIGITRIELEALASNDAALRLYRRCGFREEGVKRRARILDDREEDLVCMALLL